MTSPKAEQAALNNALWCDTVCASHGCPGVLQEEAWINLQPTPPFYPNMVTLGGSGQTSAHQECAARLLHADLLSGWGIKDSFAALELQATDAKIAFEAQWLYLSPSVSLPAVSLCDVSWEIVTTSSTLEAWEAAWSGEGRAEGIFRSGLLGRSDVTIIAARREGQIIAGAIANYAAGCVGISNLFVPHQKSQQMRTACVQQVRNAFGDLALVGYEHGEDLEAMRACGFEAVGALRVWVRGD